MKHRTDFVTNSSSANYILQLGLGKRDENGRIIGTMTNFAISPESAGSEDGWVAGEGFEPCAPAIYSDVIDAIRNKKSIDDIVDAMLENVDVLYSGSGSWDDDDYDEDDDDGDEYWDDEGTYKTLKEVYPKTIARFKQSLKEFKIDHSNIEEIVIEDCKEGGGDSAMFANFREFLADYILRYEKEEDKKKVLDEAVEFILSRPTIPVNDNEYMLDDTATLEWTGGEEALRRDLQGILATGKDGNRDYWMLRSVNRNQLNIKTGEEISESVVQPF